LPWLFIDLFIYVVIRSFIHLFVDLFLNCSTPPILKSISLSPTVQGQWAQDPNGVGVNRMTLVTEREKENALE
jgi:hypothetical protein